MSVFRESMASVHAGADQSLFVTGVPGKTVEVRLYPSHVEVTR